MITIRTKSGLFFYVEHTEYDPLKNTMFSIKIYNVFVQSSLFEGPRKRFSFFLWDLRNNSDTRYK